MKALKNIICLASLLVASVSMANVTHSCLSSTGLTLEIMENQNSLIGQTYFKITGNGQETHLHGDLVTSDQGGLISNKKYQIYGTDDLVEVVYLPQSCGRGSCRVDFGINVNAYLTLTGNQTSFYCIQ